MSIIDLEKWKKADIQRSSPYKLNTESHIKYQKVKEVISLRIRDILNKLNIKLNILSINCTWHESFISNDFFKNEKCTIEIVNSNNIGELVNNFQNIFKKNKYDIILFQLPVGIKNPDPDNFIHSLLENKLNKFGVILNISTQSSFGKKIKKFKNSIRSRQNILGPILFKESNIQFSLYEFIKNSKDILNHPLTNYPEIECIDYSPVIFSNKNFNDIVLYKSSPENFFDASNTIQQQIIKNKNKSKEFKQLHSLWISAHRCDLTKNNKKKDLVKKELKKFENAIFIPTIPSNTNSVETEIKNLKPWAYWLVILDPTKINNDYAKDYLNSKLGKEQLFSHTIGSTFKHITPDSLSNIGIVFKTLSAQKKISESKKKVEDFINASVGMFSELEEKGENFEFDPDIILKKLPNYELNKLLNLDESVVLERKETLRTDTRKKQIQSYITDSCLKTIVAFLNTKGGKLIIGQKDTKEITGIEADLFKTKDDWSKHFKDKVKTHIGLTFMEKNITQNFFDKDGKTIAIIDCRKLDGEQKAYLNNEDLYVRVGPSSEKLSAKQALELFTKKK